MLVLPIINMLQADTVACGVDSLEGVTPLDLVCGEAEDALHSHSV